MRFPTASAGQRPQVALASSHTADDLVGWLFVILAYALVVGLVLLAVVIAVKVVRRMRERGRRIREDARDAR